MARRSQHSLQQLREMIIDAAHSLIESGGAEQLSAREVARMIGYAPGTLYNAFENLDDIMLRVEARMLGELAGSLRSAIRDETGREAVASFARAYLRFAHERVRLWRLLNDHHPTMAQPAPDWYSDALSGVIKQLEEPLATLMPGACAADVAQATRALWASIHGMAVNSTSAKMGYLTLEAAAIHQQHLLDVYLDGLAAKARESRNYSDGNRCGAEGYPA